MSAAYLDCFSGISGNMLLGALLDAGLKPEALREALAGLPLSGYHLEIEQVTLQGFRCHRVEVRTAEHHPHRNLGDIRSILEAAPLPVPVRDRALAVFTRLARAEAAVHGTGVEEIHFHEVGGVDAIVDITGAVFGLHHLGIHRLTCSPLPLPRGWTACAHGDLPLPGPAVCLLLEGVPVYGETESMELVTPTGAALVRELAERFGPMPPMTLGRTGYGAGTLVRADGRPNLLRLILGTPLSVEEVQQVEVIETHIDDMNPEFWPHVAERLLAVPALDVSLSPLQMKKGRPGFLIRVVCDPAHAPAARALLLAETTAIGLRYRLENRQTLSRDQIAVETQWGPIPAKRCRGESGERITPEYEACRAAAVKYQVPLQQVYEQVLRNHRRD